MSIQYSKEVAASLKSGAPIVALESTIISHGLPRPSNLAVAQEVEEIVRAHGATPATIAILNGVVHIGLESDQLHEIANRDDISKASIRDLAIISAGGLSAATTVAATSHIARLAGISVFATGGLGGVHRDANQTYDESTDLTTLGNTPIAVVSAGVKSILDVPATLERLETLGVLVLGFQTKKFPGFYLTDSGYDLEWQVDSSLAIAKILKQHEQMKYQTATIIANPISEELQLPKALHDQILTAGLVAAKQAGITGKQATPFLLEFFHRETKGESLRVNIDVVRSNARLAAQIAVKLSELK